MLSKKEALGVVNYDHERYAYEQLVRQKLQAQQEWKKQRSLWDTIPNPPRNVMATDCFMDESGIYIEGGHTRLKLAPALIKKLAGLITIAELAKIVVPDEG